MKKFLFQVFIALLGLGALGLLAAAVWLWTSDTGRQWRAQLGERSPNDALRHLQRRLQGHTRLEAVLLPALQAAQRRLEVEPPAGALPDLGKGQRSEPAPRPAGLVQTRRVDSPQAIREALMQATPGTDIVVAPGLYPFETKLRLGQDGTALAPIALRAERPGTVWFAFGQVEGVLVDKAHWRFENLDIRGVCPRHDDCEHAFHVVGRGHHVVIRNNRIRDFNAAIKVNGWDGDWPDHGLLAQNTLVNSGPRQTDKPVVMFDLVGASHWRIQDNHVAGFVKAHGNQVSYGLFAKGASEDARFERNLVVCTPSGISQPGVRVGISFGGGGTDPGACRSERCAAHEHRGGLAANNIVAHCNDVGLDANRAQDIQLLHNTLVNTAGIGARNGSGVRLRANLSDAGVWVRDGSRVDRQLDARLAEFFDPALARALQWRAQPATANAGIPAFADTDFHRIRRSEIAIAGALN